jgi:uncharacterized protein YdeI (YjbR/CyaY-like superfamily)
MTTNVDTYFTDGCGRCALGGTPECKVHKWQQELVILRSYLLDCGLGEEAKWGMPCYTFQNNNLILLSAFKDYCSLNFFKGALLSNADGLLESLTENVQSARVIKFTNVQEVIERENGIKTCIYEAIEVEKAGLKVVLKKTSEFEVPSELQQKLDENPVFKSAFESLTPGRQRGYLLFFAAPKQSKTRVTRIENAMPQIFNGKGIHD